MNNKTKAAVDTREAIDRIEEAYEFMLAYAAQGRKQELEIEGASQIRGYLERLDSALATLSASSDALMSGHPGGEAFAGRFIDDLKVMQSVVKLLTSQPAITSDMIDNTNGLISVRSFLTDLFFIDQVVLPMRQGH